MSKKKPRKPVNPPLRPTTVQVIILRCQKCGSAPSNSQPNPGTIFCELGHEIGTKPRPKWKPKKRKPPTTGYQPGRRR